jgi:Lon protease-like protein
MDEKQPPSEEQPDELTRKMSQWQKANPDATLTEMEEAVEAELAQLRKQLVEEMVREKEVASQEAADCPNVVRKWSRMGGGSGS